MLTTEAVFAALSDPTRRALLDLLREQGSQPAGRLAASFSVSRPAISRHLRLLRQARLVRERRQGRHRVYQLSPQPLQAVDDWLEWYRVFWRGKLDQLKTFTEGSRR
jgi:DNA-binding transcriptional ArsR family regulator